MSIQTRPKANRAIEVFASGQSANGNGRANAPNGKGRLAPASSKVNGATAKANTDVHESQTQSADLFGPPQEWSSAAEHWSLEQWQAIHAILFNGNTDPHEFLLCHESPNPKERFNKAKRAGLGWHVEQAYQTVAGSAKRRSGIGCYPWNGPARRESYWGAIDIDAHTGQSSERARELAAKLVAHLQSKSTLAVIACTSGSSGGWHVFMFRTVPRPIDKWSGFLRKLAAEIGATNGECELHPIETLERPRGIRVPGSLNPKDGSFGLIAFDTLTPRLREWKELLSALPASSAGSCPRAAIIVLGQLFVNKLCASYAIRSVRTRQKRMVQMIGTMVNQCGEGLALKAVAQQYKQAQPAPDTPLTEALALFARPWRDLTRKEVDKLNSSERRQYLSFKSDTDRRAFLIIRNWLVKGDGFVHRNSLAARLEVTPQYATKIRTKFCERGIMRMTQDYVIHQLSRRYQWLLSED